MLFLDRMFAFSFLESLLILACSPLASKAFLGAAVAALLLGLPGQLLGDEDMCSIRRKRCCCRVIKVAAEDMIWRMAMWGLHSERRESGINETNFRSKDHTVNPSGMFLSSKFPLLETTIK
jgi:hypothetical protein